MSSRYTDNTIGMARDRQVYLYMGLCVIVLLAIVSALH